MSEAALFEVMADMLYELRDGHVNLRYARFLSVINEDGLDQLIDNYRDAQGIIIDSRDNGGGQLLNAEIITKRHPAGQ